MSQQSRNNLPSDRIQHNQHSQEAEDTGTAEQLLREMQEEIAPEATPLWTFVNNNAPKIVAGVITVVVVILGVAFYQGYQESALAEAKVELAVINSNNDNAKRLTALEAFKDGAPSEVLLAVELEIARTAILLNDFSKAENSYRTAMEMEDQSPLGLSIATNLADLLAKQGQAEKSLEVYESIVAKTPSQFQFPIYASIGDIALEANQNVKAKEAYQKALDLLPVEAKDSDDANYFRRKIEQIK